MQRYAGENLGELYQVGKRYLSILKACRPSHSAHVPQFICLVPFIWKAFLYRRLEYSWFGVAIAQAPRKQ